MNRFKNIGRFLAVIVAASLACESVMRAADDDTVETAMSNTPSYGATVPPRVNPVDHSRRARQQRVRHYHRQQGLEQPPIQKTPQQVERERVQERIRNYQRRKKAETQRHVETQRTDRTERDTQAEDQRLGRGYLVRQYLEQLDEMDQQAQHEINPEGEESIESPEAYRYRESRHRPGELSEDYSQRRKQRRRQRQQQEQRAHQERAYQEGRSAGHDGAYSKEIPDSQMYYEGRSSRP